MEYAQVSEMGPYDPIPPPSQAAQESAISHYDNITKSYPTLVEEFESRFYAWKSTWHPSLSSNARERCLVDEFETLVDMGPKILPLIVHQLLDKDNFTAVFLYNELEQDTKYLIDPNDVLNFLVLQRQSNLIVDINLGRKWEM
ncbi:hypothetical protein F4678DRAFT_413336 [Xylaria arbuscula]|nr:hypothetical protein F4678DRAFT_413336 [Xylaria arbuscula]